MLRCEGCGTDQVSYNSCRNRHCPKCQSTAAQRWLDARQPTCCRWSTTTWSSRCRRPSPTSRTRTRPRSTGCCSTWPPRCCRPSRLTPGTWARIGATLVLHTWGSALTHHPHVHGIVPGGGLSLDGQRWVACRRGFFLPVRVLSRLFRRRFLEELQRLHAAGKLRFFGEHVDLADAMPSGTGWRRLRRTEWVVYAKRPFAGPEAVLYLPVALHAPGGDLQQPPARHGRARRDLPLEGLPGQGRTRYKAMTLAPEEFMRRFLLHVLPGGFHRIRHYGLLANGHRRHNSRRFAVALAACR